jgi:hypothetical protein
VSPQVEGSGRAMCQDRWETSMSLGVTCVTSGMVDETKVVPRGPKNLCIIDHELAS